LLTRVKRLPAFLRGLISLWALCIMAGIGPAPILEISPINFRFEETERGCEGPWKQAPATGEVPPRRASSSLRAVAAVISQCCWRRRDANRIRQGVVVEHARNGVHRFGRNGVPPDQETAPLRPSTMASTSDLFRSSLMSTHAGNSKTGASGRTNNAPSEMRLRTRRSGK